MDTFEAILLRRSIRQLTSENLNDVILISLVAIGHPNISKGFDDRYKPAKIHYNRW